MMLPPNGLLLLVATNNAILPWQFLLRERQSAARGDDKRQIIQTHEKDRAANFTNNTNPKNNSRFSR
jgi:hypothetical protein